MNHFEQYQNRLIVFDMYFLNKVISELFPCEFRTDDKFACLSYNTYECGREIEIG